MVALSPFWQRIAVLGICVSAAIFIAGSAWYVVGLLAPVLSLFFGGWLVACMLEPLVAAVAHHTHAPRSTAVVSTYVAALLLIVFASMAVAPGLADQVDRSIADLPDSFNTTRQRATSDQSIANAWLSEHRLPLRLDIAAATSVEGLPQELRGRLESAALLPLAMVGNAFGVLGSIGMMLLLSLFFLLGGQQLSEQVVQMFGSRAAGDVRFVLTAVHDAFESFVRAQFLQCVMYAAAVWVCLTLAQVASAPLIGLAAGVLLLVPVLGGVLAVLLPVLATILFNPSAALAVGGAVVACEQLVLNVVGPRLMGKQLGMPPLLVLFGVLAGGQVAGLWGAIFGVPTLAALLACADHFRPRGSEQA